MTCCLICFSVTENLYGGRFHTHLRDTFAPQVIRYVDLMESTIAQSLHKHFEKEKWDTKGSVSGHRVPVFVVLTFSMFCLS